MLSRFFCFILLSAKHSDLKFDLLICRTADYIHVYPTSTGEKTVYWVVIRQIGGLFNQHNASNSKSFTGQLLYLLDYRAYTWQITAKSRTNVHLADNNNFVYHYWKKIVKLLQNLRSKTLNGDLPIDKKLSTCYGWKIPKLL